MLLAVPAIMLIADSMLAAFRSGIFSSAISRTGYSEYWAGMMFLNGEEGFIEKNKQKALHWLNLSCMEGFDTGCEEFEKLTNG